MSRFLDFFGFGPKQATRREQRAAIDSKIKEVVHLQHAIEDHAKERNPALDLQKAMRRRQRKNGKRS